MPFPYLFPIYFGGTPTVIPAAESVQLGIAIGRLAQYLKITYDAQPNVKSILAALTNEVAELDLAFESIVDGRQDPLSVGGEVLDVLGGIVGQPRDGLSDAAYYPFIQARIAANNSSGTVPNIYGFFALVLPGGVTMALTVRPPCNFVIYLTGAITASLASALQNLLHNARAAGVEGILDYGLHPTNQLFGFDGVSPGFDQGYFRGQLA